MQELIQILPVNTTKVQCDILADDNEILQQKCEFRFPEIVGHAHCRTLGNVLEEGLAVEKRNIKDKKDIILDLNKELELYRCSFSRVSKMLDDFQGALLNLDLFNYGF